MDVFTNEEGSKIIFDMIKIIQENKVYLGEIDGAIGDGDHGINMNKGFTLAKERLEGNEQGFTQSLNTLGTILLTEIGGSMGPLYGTLFRHMAKAGCERIDRDCFGKMLRGAKEGLENISEAKIGDKTLMDVLVPAVAAFTLACDQDLGFAESLESMQKSAEEGKESTFNMVAKVGRASRLGERSRGCLDAGATSCNLILQSMAEAIKKLI